MAGAAAIAALMGIVALAVFAWRVFGENVERSKGEDAVLVCRSCTSKAVHPSYRSGLLDHLFALFSCTPYRCAVCSWRFYVHRPHSAGRTASQAH
jgi:hypothetical protein